ncbi:uncharacterized protein LTR77_007326 [Saxophila tyrrhenica]|uniref:non-specific serine/threonine protein kinase n=1 Tax=Saxophila tyrrhenica TaxID=1690608 RepID=A0AAV9P868_9PEZI|nr:hypothetical protein LTR77_007326 [Saxophila tyrrhenica]
MAPRRKRAQADSEEDVAKENSPQKQDGEKRASARREYDQDVINHRLRAPDVSGRWRPTPILGDRYAGSEAKGCVWLMLDDDDVIIKRVYRKDTFMSKKAWTHPTLWAGDVNDLDTREPNELATHSEVSGNEGIVELFVTMDQRLVNRLSRSYRVYTLYAPHESLGDVFRWYKEEPKIPEPFIWYVAENLAKAGEAMKGKEIVHRDIKPENIFLDNAVPYQFEKYPQPLLGDFGLAFFSSGLRRGKDFDMYRRAGTLGFKAPEQFDWSSDSMDEKTNVYAVGLVLWSLVTRSEPPQFQPDDAVKIDGIHPALELAEHDTGEASSDLVDLIEKCLQDLPDDRIDFNGMLEYIEQRMRLAGSDTIDRVSQMRENLVDDAVWTEEGIVVEVDKYELKTARWSDLEDQEAVDQDAEDQEVEGQEDGDQEDAQKGDAEKDSEDADAQLKTEEAEADEEEAKNGEDEKAEEPQV